MSEPTPASRLHVPMLWLLALLAICSPTLLARNLSPSATFFNQALSLGGWGAFLIYVFGHAPPKLRRDQLAPALAMAVLVLGVILSMLLQRLPGSLALSALGMMFAGIVAYLGGVASRQAEDREAIFGGVCMALLVAGLAGFAIAMVQTFAPGLGDKDGDWIAKIAGHGRAGGNLRQPNHLSSLLLWAMVALVWLHDTRIEKPGSPARIAWRVASALALVMLVFGDVLTASRTGIVCILLVGAWGLLDRRLSRYSRVLLWVAPLAYALCWFGMTEWAQGSGQGFVGNAQLHRADLSSSRFGIWSNAMVLLKEHPWFGVGWGEFNFAWTLTSFPDRPVAFFDHTHNLPLQFLVELGVPLGLLALGLLAWSLVKAAIACWRPQDGDGSLPRASMVMVLMMVVHSMLEYPLWYAYFLLPTAFALGVCLGGPPAAEAVASMRRKAAFVAAAVVLSAGAVASVIDYTRVTVIFSADDETPLGDRIVAGQKSWFFAHHADYAAATVAAYPSTVWPAFRRAPHFLLDTRLQMAWARAFAEKGDVERARYLVERLREFRNPDAAEFFAQCDVPREAGAPAPFQCNPSTRRFTYNDFKLR